MCEVLNDLATVILALSLISEGFQNHVTPDTTQIPQLEKEPLLQSTNPTPTWMNRAKASTFIRLMSGLRLYQVPLPSLHPQPLEQLPNESLQMATLVISPVPPNQVKTDQLIKCELYCALDYVRQCGGGSEEVRLKDMVGKSELKIIYKIIF